MKLLVRRKRSACDVVIEEEVVCNGRNPAELVTMVETVFSVLDEPTEQWDEYEEEQQGVSIN